MSTPEQSPVIIVTVDGVDYDLDLTEFSGTETGILKRTGRIGGVAEIGPALQAGDLELVCALAVVAARRVGVTLDAAGLLDAKMGVVKIRSTDVDAEADASPPARSAAPLVAAADAAESAA